MTDRVGNVKVLRRVKEDKNVLHTVKRKKANWIGYVLHMTSSKLHYSRKAIKRDIVKERQGRRRSRYWMTLKKRQYAGNLKRKNQMALCGTLSLEDDMS